jgi:hypothetical protein
MTRHHIIDTPNYNTTYLNKLHKLLQAVNDKAAYATFRNNIIKRQKGKDYQMESDRINGILANSALSQTHPNYQRLKHRAEELKKLGAKAFDRGIDE